MPIGYNSHPRNATNQKPRIEVIARYADNTGLPGRVIIQSLDKDRYGLTVDDGKTDTHLCGWWRSKPLKPGLYQVSMFPQYKKIDFIPQKVSLITDDVTVVFNASEKSNQYKEYFSGVNYPKGRMQVKIGKNEKRKLLQKRSKNLSKSSGRKFHDNLGGTRVYCLENPDGENKKRCIECGVFYNPNAEYCMYCGRKL